MCSNYLPVTRMDRLLTFFGVERSRDEAPQDVFPLGMAPFIRLAVEGQEGGRPALVAEDGMFGLLPTFATELQYGRRTYNARTETVDKLPSFRPAWEAAQRCIVPAEAVYEPNWETGRAVRWRVAQEGDVPLGIAGVYRRWRDPAGGQQLFTFTMLTVNADAHPMMKRFCKPGEETRMVALLDRADYLPWLTCPLDIAKSFLKPWAGVLVAEAAPLARPSKAQREPPPQDELF
jgi:putative SOS response-associated peptidase YedK